MSNIMRAKWPKSVTTAAAFLTLGLMTMPALAAENEVSSATRPQEVVQALSAKQQAIPLIAAAMAVSDMPRLNDELNKGLNAGLTINEAKEIFVQLYAYTGFPRSLNALGELVNVIEQRKVRGIQDPLGQAPRKPISSGEELRRRGTITQTKISGAPVTGPVFDFAPIINEYLQSHLFGAIFERDNLDWRSRELATVGAFAATSGVESQLRSHMRASLRVGISPMQLRQVINDLAKQGLDGAATRARSAFEGALTDMNINE